MSVRDLRPAVPVWSAGSFTSTPITTEKLRILRAECRLHACRVDLRTSLDAPG